MPPRAKRTAAIAAVAKFSGLSDPGCTSDDGGLRRTWIMMKAATSILAASEQNRMSVAPPHFLSMRVGATALCMPVFAVTFRGLHRGESC